MFGLDQSKVRYIDSDHYQKFRAPKIESIISFKGNLYTCFKDYEGDYHIGMYNKNKDTFERLIAINRNIVVPKRQDELNNKEGLEVSFNLFLYKIRGELFLVVHTMYVYKNIIDRVWNYTFNGARFNIGYKCNVDNKSIDNKPVELDPRLPPKSFSPSGRYIRHIYPGFFESAFWRYVEGLRDKNDHPIFVGMGTYDYRVKYLSDKLSLLFIPAYDDWDILNNDNHVFIFNHVNNTLVYHIIRDKHVDGIVDIEFLPDCNRLVLLINNTHIYMYDVPTTPIESAMAGLFREGTDLNNEFENQWLYDSRVWRKINQFLD